jgi:hypothetical protein
MLERPARRGVFISSDGYYSVFHVEHVLVSLELFVITF